MAFSFFALCKKLLLYCIHCGCVFEPRNWRTRSTRADVCQLFSNKLCAVQRENKRTKRVSEKFSVASCEPNLNCFKSAVPNRVLFFVANYYNPYIGHWQLHSFITKTATWQCSDNFYITSFHQSKLWVSKLNRFYA